jgi:hypothetical protein
MNAPRSYALGLVLAVVLLPLGMPSALDAQDEFERQVRNQLDAVSETFRNDGYTLAYDIYMGRLDDDDDDAITFDLLRGQTYMIMGVCDTDCSDLDLTLYDGDGDEVDSDLATDDVPIVSVTTDRADTYRVEISMAECSAEPCRFGVGVYGGTGSSGTSTVAKGSGTGSAPNWQATPTYGTIDLDAGFTPDPYDKAISAGGDDEVDLSAPSCSGYIHAEAPDLDLNYDAGSLELFIYARAKTDVTLVVNQPDGTWICNDDEMGTDPMIRLQSPRSGNYNIWIGTYEASESPLPPATLYISELDPR